VKILLICLFVYLAICFVGTLYVHFRGKTRLRFSRQYLEHSGLLSPLNGLFYLFSKVSRDPILPTDTFPELALLKENWETIRDEARGLVDGDHIQRSERHNDLAFVAFYRRGWKRFYLRWYHDFLPSARELCPKTVALIDSIPNATAAAFTMLPPGTELGRHRDPFALAIRYHLGLITPNSDDCAIWVDGQKHSWRDGEDFVFDETYVHWARNDTDQNRVILFVDVMRPMHTRFMRWFGRMFGKYVLSHTRTNNVAEEKVGLANHITPAIYRLKTFFISAKDWNRTVYYAVKRSIGLGVLVLTVWWVWKG